MWWAMSRRCRSRISNGDDPLLELPDFRIGKNGIEKAYDLELRGTAGTSQVEVNAFGQVVRELAREDGMAGPGDRARPRHGAPGPGGAALHGGRQRRLRRCSMPGPARSWRMASTPGYDPGAFAAGLTQRDVAEARHRSAEPAQRQGDQRRLRAGLDVQAAGRHGGARCGRHHRPTPSSSAPASSRSATRCSIAGRRAGTARCRCAARSRNRATCSSITPPISCGIDRIAAMANRFGLGVELGIEIPGERNGLIPTPRLEARDHRRDVAARRHDQLRHRPELCLGDAAAACDLCGAARDRAHDRAAAGARAGRDDRAERRPPPRSAPTSRSLGVADKHFDAGAQRHVRRRQRAARHRLSTPASRTRRWRWPARPARRRCATSPRPSASMACARSRTCRGRSATTRSSSPSRRRTRRATSAPSSSSMAAIPAARAARWRRRSRATCCSRRSSAIPSHRVPPEPFGAPAEVAQG